MLSIRNYSPCPWIIARRTMAQKVWKWDHLRKSKTCGLSFISKGPFQFGQLLSNNLKYVSLKKRQLILFSYYCTISIQEKIRQRWLWTYPPPLPASIPADRWIWLNPSLPSLPCAGSRAERGRNLSPSSSYPSSTRIRCYPHTIWPIF